MRHFISKAVAVPAAALALVFIGCEATGPASSEMGRLLFLSNFNENGTYTTLPQATFTRPFGEVSLEAPVELVSFLRRNSVHSLIVSQGDDVILETYLHQHQPETLWNVHGISTTMIAAAVGTALEEDKIRSVDQYISLNLPQFGGSGITWRHLLSMTANLDYMETPHLINSDTVDLFAADDFDALVEEPALDESREPGSEFHYSSLVAQIMAAGLEAAYDQSIDEIITEKIWQPMGAEFEAQWDTAESSQTVRAGYGLHMTSRDLWRLGRFLAVDIEDQVEPDFVAEMRGPVSGRGRFFRRAESRLISPARGFGFGTWFVRFPLNGEMVAGYGSIGLGGQTVLYIPRYDMTLSVLSRVSPRQGRINFLNSVLEYVLDEQEG